MNNHHLVLGQLADFITGETITDSHDERYRQQIARQLVFTHGYQKADILPRQPLTVCCDRKTARLLIDFQVRLLDRIHMLIQYAPGSITTRHRPVLAMSRLAVPYQIPVVVVTNGQSAEVLSGETGRKIGEGLAAIPSRSRLSHLGRSATWQPLSDSRKQMEAKILYAYEINDRCPCDDTVCRL